MNILGGNSLLNFSLFALGISPYITSSIIIQLLSMMEILPKLSDLSKQGEKGRKKLDNATRYLTLLLAAVQGYGTILLMQNNGQNNGLAPAGGQPGDTFGTWDYVYITITLVAGSMFVMWLADRISSKGIGNGVSMIITAGIVTTIPSQFSTAYKTFVTFFGSNDTIVKGILNFLLYVLVYLLFIVFVVFIEKSVRKVPLQHSQNTMAASDIHHLPSRIYSGNLCFVIHDRSCYHCFYVWD
jgi:preprotein translocase subunit SecY